MTIPGLATTDLIALIERADRFRFGDLALGNQFMIERRRDDQWVIVFAGGVLTANGDIEYEPIPSARTDETNRRTRFSLPAAVTIAETLERLLGDRPLVNIPNEQWPEIQDCLRRALEAGS